MTAIGLNKALKGLLISAFKTVPFATLIEKHFSVSSVWDSSGFLYVMFLSLFKQIIMRDREEICGYEIAT